MSDIPAILQPRPEPVSVAQLRQLLTNPRTAPFTSTGPANTATSVANLYAQPGYGELPYYGPGAGVPVNSASSVANLYPTQVPNPLNPAGPRALPPGGSTGIYNNRFLSTQQSLLDQAAGSSGATRAAGAVPRQAIGPGGSPLPGGASQAATGAAGLLSRFSNPGRGLSIAGRSLPGALGRGGLMAGAARGIGYGIIGDIGANFVDERNFGGEGSTIDQALPGAIRGASFGAPFGPWGAAIGGVAGGLSTALDLPILSDIFGGAGKSEGPEVPVTDQFAQQMSNIDRAFITSGLGIEGAAGFYQALETNLALAGPENREAALAALITPDETGVVPLIADAQSFIAQAQAPSQQMTPTDIAAIQAQVGQFVQPFAQQAVQTGNLAAAALTNPSQMGGLSPQYQQALQAQAATQRSNAARQAAAITAQAQTLPILSAHQQAIAQAYQTPQASSGGSGDLAAILEQLGAA